MRQPIVNDKRLNRLNFEFLNKTTFNNLPHKFEAGTPNAAGVIGLGEAVSFLSGLGMENVYQHAH